MSDERRQLSCPQCGQILDVTDVPPDFLLRCESCGAVFSESGSVEGEAPVEVTTEELEVSDEAGMDAEADQNQAVRSTTCPHCRSLIQVGELNPLDTGVCPICNKSFELLRDFGPFKLEQRLDVGGTAVVYRATDSRNQQKVALKILSAEALHQPGARTGFKREYALTRNLNHPNLIRIYEYGCLDGFDYLALELAEGMSVGRIMHQLPPVKPKKGSKVSRSELDMNLVVLPELVGLEITLGAAAGLGAAHEQGLVHGDVKPANFMLTRDGQVKVLDFGLVQFADVEQLFAETEQDQIFGTAFYIPPERVRGEKEDFRSDIYSLGASLFHMLSGRAPFYAKTLDQIAMMHVQDSLTSFRGKPVVKFSANSPDVSEHTLRILEKSMKKEPRERYMSHIEFIADLTLAKNQLLVSMGKKPNMDGKAILRRFLRTVPGCGLFSSFWNNFKVIVNHATSAITVSITKRLAMKK